MKAFISATIFVLLISATSGKAQVRTSPDLKHGSGAESSGSKSFVQAQPGKPGQTAKPPIDKKKNNPVPAPKSFRADQDARQPVDSAPAPQKEAVGAKPDSSAGPSAEPPAEERAPQDFPPPGAPRRGPRGEGFP